MVTPEGDAVVFVTAHYRHGNMAAIRQILSQAADFDLVLRARFGTLRKLSAFVEKLRDIEGIEETKSAVITDEQVLPPPPVVRV